MFILLNQLRSLLVQNLRMIGLQLLVLLSLVALLACLLLQYRIEDAA